MTQVNSNSFYADYISALDMNKDQAERVVKLHGSLISSAAAVSIIGAALRVAVSKDEQMLKAERAECDLAEIMKFTCEKVNNAFDLYEAEDFNYTSYLSLTMTERAAIGAALDMIVNPDENDLTQEEIEAVIGEYDVKDFRKFAQLFPIIYCNDYDKPESFDKLQDWLQ